MVELELPLVVVGKLLVEQLASLLAEGALLQVAGTASESCIRRSN
jgi:hypothetical protein